MEINCLIKGCIGALCLTVLGGCANKLSKETDAADAPVLVDCKFTECLDRDDDVLSCNLATDRIFELKNAEEILSEEFAINEINGNRMVVSTNDAALLFEIPSGELLANVSVGDDMKNVSNAVFSGDDDNLWVVKRDWRNRTTTFRQYDANNKPEQTILTHDSFGDVKFYTDSTFLATNSIGFDGGQFYLYILNKRFEKTDSVMFPVAIEPQEDYFLIDCPLQSDGNEFNSCIFTSDTLYNVSSALDVNPIVALDFGDKKLPEDITMKRIGNVMEYYKAMEPYIYLTHINKFGDFLFCHFEHGANAYHTIFDCKSGKLLYSRKRTDGKWGISLDVNGEKFCSWPTAIWQDNLIFGVPAKIMNNITGQKNDNAVWLATLPLSSLANALKKL